MLSTKITWRSFAARSLIYGFLLGYFIATKDKNMLGTTVVGIITAESLLNQLKVNDKAQTDKIKSAKPHVKFQKQQRAGNDLQIEIVNQGSAAAATYMYFASAGKVYFLEEPIGHDSRPQQIQLSNELEFYKPVNSHAEGMLFGACKDQYDNWYDSLEFMIKIPDIESWVDQNRRRHLKIKPEYADENTETA